MKLSWGAKVDERFRHKLVGICKGFNWTGDHANWLMAVMAFESAETFDPAIKNAAGSGATGLIQFMPTTARGLGTTTDQLAGMDAVSQLDYVRLYFQPYAQRITSMEDMYMAVLAPIGIGKHLDSPLYSHGAAYRMNAALDVNADGVITKREASRFVAAKLEKGFGYGLWANVTWEHDSTQILAQIAKIESELDDLRQMVVATAAG